MASVENTQSVGTRQRAVPGVEEAWREVGWRFVQPDVSD
jgi:hypothetical protein